MSSDTTESSGVQQLIDRLHEEGVAKGQDEADGLIAAARRQAALTLDDARREADEIVAEATSDAGRTRAAAEDAIRLACRDATLSLTDELREDFVRKLRNLVGHTLQDTDFLKQLILEIARRAVPAESAGPQNVLLLNADSPGGESAPSLDDDSLNQFVLSLGGEALREGLTFKTADSDVPGVRLQIVDEDVEIDLTTETLTHYLLKHLSPKLRAIIQQ